ncbi:hypothetical protein HLPR_01380 [Helicovermis profundi]|uniref:VOC domain-containing protein n=1 Tax=Helicovermis profundi TaxID=3065157 RepID=A0AAU9E7U7_9FIRM|nr:hypothetical protein HLPR_01380 [Clostridia bacterium S502]
MSGVKGSGCQIIEPVCERKDLKEIERSIIKKHRKMIWSKFIKGIKEYKLIEEGDKIAVAISGGKDSLIMAKLLQELQNHGKFKFDLEFIAMDPGFHQVNKDMLIDNCKHLNIPVHIFESGIFRIVDNIAKDYPCYMCAKMRRGALYNKATELGCNKLALGHHFDDVIETTMLNVLYGGTFKTMLPKLKSDNFDSLELIRPMFMIREEDIIKFTKYNGLVTMNCGCVVAAGKTSSKRKEIKDLIKTLKLTFKDVDKSIFQSANNVQLDAIIGWKKDMEKHSYLDYYNDKDIKPHHICIQTNDYEKSLEFYTNILGFELFKETKDFHNRRYNSWLKLDEFNIELQTSKNDDELTPWNKSISGIAHICFRVKDIEKTYSEIKEKGFTNFKAKNNQDVYAVNDKKLMKIVAPEGTIIEFRDSEIDK